MDVINVNNRQVIKCVHCNATGICAHSDFLFVEQKRDGVSYQGWVLSCTKCGQGHWYRSDYEGFLVKRSHQPPRNQMKPPVCAVCGGTGHIVVG